MWFLSVSLKENSEHHSMYVSFTDRPKIRRPIRPKNNNNNGDNGQWKPGDEHKWVPPSEKKITNVNFKQTSNVSEPLSGDYKVVCCKILIFKIDFRYILPSEIQRKGPLSIFFLFCLYVYSFELESLQSKYLIANQCNVKENFINKAHFM